MYGVIVISYHKIQLFHYKLHLHYMYKNMILVKDQCRMGYNFQYTCTHSKVWVRVEIRKDCLTVEFRHVTLNTTHIYMVHKKLH